MISFTYCPEPTCGALAEITERYTVGSTDGPIEHVSTHCLQRHRFVLPAEMLAAVTSGESR
jgi:hypothetical protein